MKIFLDQMQREVGLVERPGRIVSLVPSQTELLFALGLGENVVGRTKFCLHPREAIKAVPVVGGTKNFHFDKIAALHPDLIIGNKEENYAAGIQELAEAYPVWMSDILTLDDALGMITQLGEVLEVQEKARHLAAQIGQLFAELAEWRVQFVPKPLRAAYFIWKKPYMVAGGGTFIQDMLRRAGFENIFAHRLRYPEISPEELREAAPEVVLLSSEPYPFQKEKHLDEFALLCPTARVVVVDGEMFSWYGSRLLASGAYFRELWENLQAGKSPSTF
ncbi:MAG: ABC transporter substrate-binding protein [Microscillaceae bacterium]|nr:ABC transporter substrate-binding protein [Microscillaceae bacterium]